MWECTGKAMLGVRFAINKKKCGAATAIVGGGPLACVNFGVGLGRQPRDGGAADGPTPERWRAQSVGPTRGRCRVSTGDDGDDVRRSITQSSAARAACAAFHPLRNPSSTHGHRPVRLSSPNATVRASPFRRKGFLHPDPNRATPDKI
ncbi:hypothetical protein MMAN_20180 [Mycobacterium mantenii]|uniref:Uncharacterized protein n=1 Tax=Mycobacterium mantenii TaxID=560555 RepID=A0ABM7JQR4_MYCNT|nr:hypothetical protein MMAN_20180 [Mycobacterium mantenii]